MILNNILINKKKFIDKSNKIHNNKYDYSKVDYINSSTKVQIICPEHGSFFQLPSNHKVGNGCPKCNKIRKKTRLENLELLNIKHSNKYDYSLITEEWWDENYKNTNTKIPIICPEHGEFYQRFTNHLHQGSICPNCIEKKEPLLTKDKNLEDFKKAHLDKYNYSKVNYIHTQKKIEIICPEHGSFFQLPFNHKKGSGCPKCKSSKGENYIRNYLLENSFSVLEQYSFRELPNLRFDFYLEDYNLAIEYDGIQHFEVIEHFGGKDALQKTIERDEIKNRYCKDNNIYLLRIPYWEFNNIDKLIQEKIEYIYYKGKKWQK